MNFRKSHLILISALLVAMTACGGPEARKAKYAARAQQFMEEENWPKARVALRNVLKIDPKDPEAYFLFAQVEEKEKNWRNAFGNYLKVVELNPDHKEALIKLGRFYLEGRLPEKVTEMADRVLARYPEDPAAETLKAAAMATTGKIEEAIAHAEKILRRHPVLPDAAGLLSALYTSQKRLAEAEGLLRKAVEANPKNVILLRNLADTQVRRGENREAEQSFREIVKIEPKVFDHRVRLAAFYDRNKEIGKAEEALREAIGLDPENEQRQLALAEFLAARKGAKDGEAVLLEAKEALPNAMKIRFSLGQHYEVHQDFEKARRVYEEIAEQKEGRPPALEAQVKLAALDLTEGKKESAEGRLQEVLKKNPRASEALVLQGKLSLGRGEAREAVQAFRTVLKDQPERADVHALLGQAYMMLGESKLARESLEQGVALNPRELAARLNLVRLDAAEGDRKKARSRLEGILKDAPRDIESLGFLLNIQVAEREWQGAEGTLARLREAGTDPFFLEMAEGNLNQARKQWDKAIAAFERAATLRPEAPDPLFSLVRIELNQGKAGEARDRLNRIISARPDHPYAHGMLGELLLLEKDPEGAERAFREAARLKPDWMTPWIQRVTLKLSQKKSSDALKIIEEGLKANPKSNELRLIHASTLAGADQTDAAIREYERLLKDQPNLVLAANNLAVLLTEKKGDPESLERALSLSRDFEKSAPGPVFLDTLGWVYVKLGRGEEAVRVLRKAVAKAPDQPVMNYHLGIALYRKGEIQEAKVHLAKAIRSSQPFPGLEEAKTILKELEGGKG